MATYSFKLPIRYIDLCKTGSRDLKQLKKVEKRSDCCNEIFDAKIVIENITANLCSGLNLRFQSGNGAIVSSFCL